MSLLIALLTGMGFCTRDFYEGPAPRLLVKEHGAPDSQYKDAIDVYLDGNKGSSVTIDVNTNYQWFLDRPTFNSIPIWCSVTTPSGLITGNVTDKTLTFTDRGDNVHPFPQMFTLILRNSANPSVYVTINVYRNIKNESFYVCDDSVGRNIIQDFTANGVILFNGGNHDVSFEVHADREWEITIRPTGVNRSEPVNWITATSSDGDLGALIGNNLFLKPAAYDPIMGVRLEIDVNDSNRYPRTAEIEIKAMVATEGINSIVLFVRQQTANAYIELEKPSTYNPYPGTTYADYTFTTDPYTIEIEALNPNIRSGDDFTILLDSRSNREWNAAIAYIDGAGWLSIDPATGKFPEDVNTDEVALPLALTFKPNTTYADRKAIITFTGIAGDLTPTVVYITQKAKTPYCNPDRTNLFFGPSATVANGQRINISSNEEWTIDLTGGSTAFDYSITGDRYNDREPGGVYITFYPRAKNMDPNNAPTAEYTISYGDGFSQSFVINLEQGPALPTVRVDLAGTFAIPQTTDALSGAWTPEYDVSSFPSWIQSVVFNGDRTFTVSVEDNDLILDGEDWHREHSFIVRGENEDKYEMIIYQDKRWWMEITGIGGTPHTNASYPSSFTATSATLYFIGRSGGPITFGPPPAQTVNLSGYIGDNSFSMTPARIQGTVDPSPATPWSLTATNSFKLDCQLSIVPPQRYIGLSTGFTGGSSILGWRWIDYEVTIAIPKTTLILIIYVQQR
ncbi:MAG: hypothetical protein FWD56_01800 [Bacteroidales bacterium]|nr:hypothetical protein [Bacteroidales bacterium]